MKYFALKRTGDINTTFKGVETPSQKRFVNYFETLMHKLGGVMPLEKQLKLEKVLIRPIKKWDEHYIVKIFSNNKQSVNTFHLLTDVNCNV